MIKKMLIANRGEIACRIIRTCKKMGIQTVAVFSEADKNALHVSQADESVYIGPPQPVKSYLNKEVLLKAILNSKADAVHPGYGFLSEKSEFAKLLKDNNIVFVGPSESAISAMGDKIESKKLAQKAGVNTVPGFLGVIANTDEAVKIAQQIGYPVMIKASAGGGGKGMRIARTDAEVREGFVSATNEAKTSFADDRVFIEKYIEQPRHIEIQILGDQHGNVVYLFERECSIQRRHQKVFEEAPSPFLDEKTRRAMGEQAVALAKAVNYYSAGTVEFIVDSKKNFYFLEMNTRLQVEHPVTEAITGLDLVEWMIRVANGERLGFTQKDLRINGHAIEARVYAEDPYRNFLPSIGRLVWYRPPEPSNHVRIDTGVFEGDEISMYYDPMIAKLITYSRNRNEAIAEMKRALDRYYIRGVNHNISFLSAVLSNPVFVEGEISTNFIAEQFPNGFGPEEITGQTLEQIVCTLAVCHRMRVTRSASISDQMPGFGRKISSSWVVFVEEAPHPVQVTIASETESMVTFAGRQHYVRSHWKLGDRIYEGSVDNTRVVLQIERAGIGYKVCTGRHRVLIKVMTPQAAELLRRMPAKAPKDMSKYLVSPMPGLLVKVPVNEDQQIEPGETLAVIEAMKMENIIKAEKALKIKKIMTSMGSNLVVDQVIMEFH